MPGRSGRCSWIAFVLVALCSQTTPAAAEISIWAQVPSFDELVYSGPFTFSDSLALKVGVASTSPVESVRGRLGTLEFDLSGSPGTGYHAAPSTVSLARGVQPLIVTATNEAGEQAVLEYALLCDRPPVVRVAAPVVGAAASGAIDIDATCTDDGPDGCSSLMVVYSQSSTLDPLGDADLSGLVACGKDRISGTYDLSLFGWAGGWLHFLAYAPAGPGGVVASVPVMVTGRRAGAGAVTVSAPIAGQVARPTLQIAASCAGDCAAMYAWYQREAESPIFVPAPPDYRDVVACGSTEFAQTIDLSHYEGSKGWLVFASAHDPELAQASFVPIAVESHPRLCEVERVTGRILDADAGRVLLLSPDLTSLEIYDRATHRYRTLYTAQPRAPEDWWLAPFRWAKLTPFGAVFSPASLEFWEARGDALIRLAGDSGGYQVAGNFVIWGEASGLGLRDLATQTTYSVAQVAHSPHLAANGDVVFTDDAHQLFRYRQGVTSQLTLDDAAKGRPVTDGTVVIYEKVIGGSELALVLLSGGQETIVEPPEGSQGGTGYTYRYTSGWLAYTGSSSRGVTLRAPNGTTRHIPDAFVEIAGLNDRGEVMTAGQGSYHRTAGVIPKRMLTMESSTFIDPLSAGTSLLVDGVWHMAIAGSLFRIAATEECAAEGGVGQLDPDAGLPEGGVPDGAVSEGGAEDAHFTGPYSGEVADAGHAGAEDAAGDAPAPDAEAPSDLDGSPGSQRGDANGEEEPIEPEELAADSSSEDDAEGAAAADAGRTRGRAQDADCAVRAPGAPLQGAGRPALASLGLLCALSCWRRTRRRHPAAR